MAWRIRSTDHTGGGRRGRDVTIGMVGVAVGTVAGLLVGADILRGNDAAGRDVQASQPIVGQIARNPDEFVGKPARVTGVVMEILSPRAFTVGRPGFGAPELLVVTRGPLAVPTGPSASRPILEGDIAQVSGDVRTFDIGAFERDMGVDLRPDRDFFGRDLGDREGDPAIQATGVTFTSATTPVIEAASPEVIVERPRDFYGRITSVQGQVTDILPSGALVVDDTLLALTADFAQGRPQEGQRVTLVGPVRSFDPDQRRPEGGQLRDERLLERFANRPAIVAQSIEIER